MPFAPNLTRALPRLILALFFCLAVVDSNAQPEGNDSQTNEVIALPKSESQSPWFFISTSWKIKSGDDARWGSKEWDDSDWDSPGPDSSLFHEGSFHDLPSGIFWVRAKLSISDKRVMKSVDSLFHSIKGARRIYWDGQSIGGSGQPGQTQQDERPGRVFHWSNIPDELLEPGIHQLAFRISSNFEKSLDGPLFHEIYLSNDSVSFPAVFSESLTTHFMLGIAISMAGIFFLIFVFVERKSSYLVFSLICIGISVTKYSESYEIRHLRDYTYNQQLLHENGLMLTMLSLAFLFPYFMLTHFSIRPKRWHSLWIGTAILVAYVLGDSYDNRVFQVLGAGGVAGVSLAIWATYLRRPGSWLISLASLSIVLPILLDRFDDTFDELYETLRDISYIALVFSILISLTRQIGKDRTTHQQALLAKTELEASKARLETELIKSCIQPHFLMNTLNALIDWVEEDPRKGVEFIQELSRHFRILLTISGKREISLGVEIELCESLLKIMSYRKEINYRLVLEGIDTSSQIPPCVLHTLVENGVTHNEYETDEVEFKLTGVNTRNSRIYSMVTPVSSIDRDDPDHENKHQGTGLTYVESRLEESYPGEWKMQSGLIESDWVVRIELPRNGIAAAT